MQTGIFTLGRSFDIYFPVGKARKHAVSARCEPNSRVVNRTFIRWKRERVACMADLIVKAAVKEALDDKNVASDFYEALDDEVSELLEDAARRAEANDRKTVQPRDL